MARGPYAMAALRNNGSIAGRYRARRAARDDQTTLVDREVKSGRAT